MAVATRAFTPQTRLKRLAAKANKAFEEAERARVELQVAAIEAYNDGLKASDISDITGYAQHTIYVLASGGVSPARNRVRTKS